MAWIEDLVNLMRKGPQLSSELDAVKINTKSVARGANDAVLQFPCICTNTIPTDMAAVCARAMERVYASFTQSWLSLHPVMDISIDKNPIQFLKKFHQNVKWESVEARALDESDVETIFEKALAQDYNLYLSEDKKYGIFYNSTSETSTAFVESFTDGMKEHLSDFDIKRHRSIFEAPSDDVEQTIGDAALSGLEIRGKIDQMQRTGQTDSRHKTVSLLNDRDVKKSNDMLPYALEVRLMAVNEKNEFVQWFQFVVGVKTVLHLIKSNDMIDNLSNVLKNNSTFNKLLRWTSGEISLWKNIILDLDNLKYDAVAKADKRSPFFGTLKRLKAKRFGLHNGTVPHGIIPNSTIIVSDYEIAEIEKSCGLNLHDSKNARAVMRKLFLMTFIIVDNGSAIVDILYDGATEFQSYTLETLEREVSLNSNRLGKEIGRMVSSG